MKALEFLKSKQRQETLLMLVDDNDAKRMVVAWTYLYPAFTDYEIVDGETLPAVGEEAWRRCQFSHETLSRISGVPERVIDQKIYMLKSAGLIFPDGTVAPSALQIIGAEVAAKLKEMVNQK